MRQRKSFEMAPGADLRKDISLENEMYWFKRHNLRGANLSGTDLREAQLSGTNLLGTDLSRVDLLFKANQLGFDLSMSRVKLLLRASLSDTDLLSADLRSTDLLRNDLLLRTNLRGACLSTAELLLRADPYRTDLWSTGLSEADLLRAELLLRADLRGANLEGAKLKQANLLRADLSRADLNRAGLSQADLRGADLSGTNLRDADLHGANLSRANLDSADLSGANLYRAHLSKAYLGKANLSGARLSQADLSEASLIEAKFRGADLSGADLKKAHLREADLRGANLSKANLSGAHLFQTFFAFIDFRSTRGLVEIDHEGPSHVELQTVQLPNDGTAVHFLRGAGVLDEWIDFYRATMMHPIQYHSLFLSYSSKDETLARCLHTDLQDHGVRCWFAPEDLKIGEKIRARIDEAIHLQDKLLLLLSKHALASSWVEDEVEAALEKEQRQQREVLFPVCVDESVMQTTKAWAAKLRRSRYIGDFTRWTDPQAYQQAFERLLRDLKA